MGKNTNLLIVILLFAGVVFWDYVPIIKQGEKKEIRICAVLFAVSFLVLVLYSLDVPMPSFYQLLNGICKA